MGVASATGKFTVGLVVLSSHEDHIAQLSILNFVKSLGVTPRFVMGKYFSHVYIIITNQGKIFKSLYHYQLYDGFVCRLL